MGCKCRVFFIILQIDSAKRTEFLTYAPADSEGEGLLPVGKEPVGRKKRLANKNGRQMKNKGLPEKE